MGYCANCGKALEENSEFCPYCGIKLGGESETHNKIIHVWMLLPLFIVLVVLSVGIFLRNRPITINLENYLDIFFDGYDGYGTAYVWIAEEAFDEAVAKALQKKGIISDDEYSAEYTDYPQFYVVRGQVAYDLDRKSGLMNGDTVHLDLNYDNQILKKYGLRFKGGTISEKVYGLAEVEEFDPFEAMQISFEGYSSYGTADIGWKEDTYSELSYTVDKKENLKNGDVITVTVSPDQFSDFDAYAAVHGRSPSAVEQKYKVFGLEEIQEFDPFDELAISFQGISGAGTISIDSSALADGLRCVTDKRYKLSNEDTVTVEVFPLKDNFTEYEKTYGMRASRTVCEYEVSGLAFYVDDLVQISEENMNILDTLARNTLLNDVDETWESDEQMSDITLVGAYLLYPTETGTGQENLLYLVYKILYSNGDGTRKDYFTYRCCKNVLLYPDGSCETDIDENDAPGKQFEQWWEHSEDAIMMDENHYVYGYETLEDIFTACVKNKLDRFEYTTNIVRQEH